MRLKDGDGFEIAGTLASFDGASYVVEARAFGRLKLEAKRYDCVGPGCNKTSAPTAPQVATLSLEPQHAAASNDFTIEGADAVSLSLLPGLVRGYATSINASSAQLLGVDPRQMRFRLTSGKGRGVSMIDVRRSDFHLGARRAHQPSRRGRIVKPGHHGFRRRRGWSGPRRGCESSPMSM